MNKNNNLSQLDTNQIVQKMFDDKLDAQRVSIIGGSDIKIDIDPSQITNAIKEGLKGVTFQQKIPDIVPFLTEKEVEKHVFIPQIQKIEVPVIIKEIEYKTVEIPVIVKEYITVEIPVIHKEIELKEVIKERNYPLIIKVCTIMQTVAILGILLLNFLRK